MKKWTIIDKEVGQTPLQALEIYKKQKPEYSEMKMAYAGRLDPMASGKLLVLIGDECKNQETYHALDKTYEVEILLGATSDSGDVLGIVESCDTPKLTNHYIKKNITKMSGNFTSPYPKFSSKTVNGKPLFQWTLENKLDEIKIPQQKSYIYRIHVKNIHTLTGAIIVKKARQKIRSLPTVTDVSKALGADFRRKEVEATWTKFLEKNKDRHFTLITISCTCSSGTYMRSLASSIGKKLNTCALAYSIHRTKIGRIVWLPFGLSFWRLTFK